MAMIGRRKKKQDRESERKREELSLVISQQIQAKDNPDIVECSSDLATHHLPIQNAKKSE